MGRNNEDARNGLERPDIPGFEGTMGMLNNFVSKYTKNFEGGGIYRKGEDQSGLEDAAALQRSRDEIKSADKKKSTDDQSGYTGAKMAFTPFVGGITENTKALPVSGTELAKETARRKSGAVDKFGMKNHEHKVNRKKQRKKGTY